LTTDSGRTLLWCFAATWDSREPSTLRPGRLRSMHRGDGNRAVRSWHYPDPGGQRQGVLTIEGLAKNGQLHPLQEAFAKHGALQCGYCTPGMIMNAYSLLQRNPEPTREQIVNAWSISLCRCAAHIRIIRAIETAAAEMKGAR